MNPSLTANRPTAEQLAQHRVWQAARTRMGFVATTRRQLRSVIDTRPAVAVPMLAGIEPVPVNLLSPPNVLVILKLVALRHGVKVREIVGSSRLHKLSAVRQEAVFLVWTHTGRSLADLGSRIFHRDHTTCIHSIKKHLVKRPDLQWLSDRRRAEEGAEVRSANALAFPLFDRGLSRRDVAKSTGLLPWQVEAAANRHYWHVRSRAANG